MSMSSLLQLSVSRYTNLLQHKKNMHREKAIICGLCGENFYTKANLNRHTLTKHKDLAPVECPVCYKGFSRKDNLKKHMKDVHFRTAATVVKQVKDNFPCDFCRKQFTTLQNLKRHKKNVHFIISDSRVQIEDKKSIHNNTMNDVTNDISDSSFSSKSWRPAFL